MFQGFFELKTKCQFYSKLRSLSTDPQVYMAPEAMERDEFTAAADVYSFGEEGGREGEEGVRYQCVMCAGMVMWEVATGEVPFASDLKQLSPVLLVMRLLMGYRPVFTASHNQVRNTLLLSSSSEHSLIQTS